MMLRQALTMLLLVLYNLLYFCTAFVSSSQKFLHTTTRLEAQSGKKKKKEKGNTIAVNRLAYRNYEIIDTLEAGISLKGSEVKSIRDGKMNLRDGYVRPSKDGRGCTLFNVHIGKHTMSSSYFQHEEKRPRSLLVHKEQARRLLQQTEQQSMTIVPIKAYWNEVRACVKSLGSLPVLKTQRFICPRSEQSKQRQYTESCCHVLENDSLAYSTLCKIIG
jgi:SsrA-binding protein